MIKAPLALFQVQVKSSHGHGVELLQAAFGKAPEALDPVNVAMVINELVRAMVDSEVLRIADINQSVIAAPAIRVDDGIGGTRPGIMACKVAFLHSATISV